MLHKFKDFIAEEQLFDERQKVLLAVSGGLDSVSMCYLFKQAGFNFSIAHCNFKLRGEEADEDEKFVKNLAQKLNVMYYSQSFETEKIARQKKESIQVTARELRYDWFNKIAKTFDYQWIATAHHLNDSIETVLYNFTKGCGIRGLHGIPAKNGTIIRPLLFATRDEIEFFAKEAQISFREDVSNASDKYMRNKIRQQVIPVLKTINPAFENTAKENIERLKETEAIFEHAIEAFRASILEEKNGLIYIDFKALPHNGKTTVLYELLKPFGFNNDQCKQILYDNHAQSGNSFFSSSHRLVIDRSFFVLNKIDSVDSIEHLITQNTAELKANDKLFLFKELKSPPEPFSTDKNVAYLDLNKLVFPLKLRKWKQGDIFQPLGMNGKKQKVKDFFVHQKLSIPEKEKVWILESDDKICWIVGLRIDERFKITKQTKNYFHIKVKTR